MTEDQAIEMRLRFALIAARDKLKELRAGPVLVVTIDRAIQVANEALADAPS